MKLTRINSERTALLEDFLAHAGSSLETFRYFSSRSFEVLRNHLVTFILEKNGKALAYGHLDRENETVWLGTCVIEKEKGRGLGKKMMQALLSFAEMNCIPRIKLSVDNANSAAQSLYIQHGFKKTEQRETFSFFEWENKSLPFILVSTLAFMGKSAEEIVQLGQENQLAIEFSSGMPFREDMEKIFLEAPVKRFAHNYFPAPQKAFVLNLASVDDETRNRSIAHCLHGMELSYAAGAPFFSAHAGFCVDPKPEELGKQLSRKAHIDKSENWNLFRLSLEEIFLRTRHLSTRFLIENNVLAKMNVYENGLNPLFCADADEMLRLMQEMNEPRLGILLDTAHLKVSSATLGFDKEEELEKIKGHIGCIHHSDNPGDTDNNQEISEDYWFLKHMSSFRRIPHVIEVKKIPLTDIRAEIAMLKKAAG